MSEYSFVKQVYLQRNLVASRCNCNNDRSKKHETAVSESVKSESDRVKLTPQKAAIVYDGFLPNRNSLPSRPAGLHVLLITLRHLVPQNYMLPNGLLMVIGFSAL